MNKNSKTVVITGGTEGIGASIAREFYGRGMSVLIGARHDNGFSKKLGPYARFQKMDVRRENDHKRILQAAIRWKGGVDIYVNCAGFSAWQAIEGVDEQFWDTMMDTNLKGTFWGCKAASQCLKKGGCIINISSLAGKRGSAYNSVYCASKFGVTGLTQSLAKELGPKGIRVNAICPVYIETTELLKALKGKWSPARGSSIKAYLKKFALDNAALKRLPGVNEVAKVCAFLASDEASAITGQSLIVDCGVLPQ